uniref:Transcription termination factor NusA n=1 Tax=Sciadococcus taiwanensis TaxID=3028030 RepID=A0A9Y1MX16_9RHOD|nr:transcription termination factor NusA [Sciadococcus taiwanensis]
MAQLPGLKSLLANISKERNIPIDYVKNALKCSLYKSYEKYQAHYLAKKINKEYTQNFFIELDLENESFRIITKKVIVKEVVNSQNEISLNESLKINHKSTIGEILNIDITPEKDNFGRLLANHTRQVLHQQLNKHQYSNFHKDLFLLEGNLVSAKVIRKHHSSIILCIENFKVNYTIEGQLPIQEQVIRDNYILGNIYKVYVKKVLTNINSYSSIILSRADPGLIVNLLMNEIPELENKLLKIIAIARDKHSLLSVNKIPRTKVALISLDSYIDPIGACIGPKGSRIHAIMKELNGEKVDIVRWSQNPVTYIINALSPAKIKSVQIVDMKNLEAQVIVEEDQLSLAIGKDGQNVRLATQLTNWKIDIKSNKNKGFK